MVRTRMQSAATPGRSITERKRKKPPDDEASLSSVSSLEEGEGKKKNSERRKQRRPKRERLNIHDADRGEERGRDQTPKDGVAKQAGARNAPPKDKAVVNEIVDPVETREPRRSPRRRESPPKRESPRRRSPRRFRQERSKLTPKKRSLKEAEETKYQIETRKVTDEDRSKRSRLISVDDEEQPSVEAETKNLPRDSAAAVSDLTSPVDASGPDECKNGALPSTVSTSTDEYDPVLPVPQAMATPKHPKDSFASLSVINEVSAVCSEEAPADDEIAPGPAETDITWMPRTPVLLHTTPLSRRSEKANTAGVDASQTQSPSPVQRIQLPKVNTPTTGVPSLKPKAAASPIIQSSKKANPAATKNGEGAQTSSQDRFDSQAQRSVQWQKPKATASPIIKSSFKKAKSPIAHVPLMPSDTTVPTGTSAVPPTAQPAAMLEEVRVEPKANKGWLLVMIAFFVASLGALVLAPGPANVNLVEIGDMIENGANQLFISVQKITHTKDVNLVAPNLRASMNNVRAAAPALLLWMEDRGEALSQTAQEYWSSPLVQNSKTLLLEYSAFLPKEDGKQYILTSVSKIRDECSKTAAVLAYNGKQLWRTSANNKTWESWGRRIEDWKHGLLESRNTSSIRKGCSKTVAVLVDNGKGLWLTLANKTWESSGRWIRDWKYLLLESTNTTRIREGCSESAWMLFDTCKQLWVSTIRGSSAKMLESYHGVREFLETILAHAASPTSIMKPSARQESQLEGTEMVQDSSEPHHENVSSKHHAEPEPMPRSNARINAPPSQNDFVTDLSPDDDNDVKEDETLPAETEAPWEGKIQQEEPAKQPAPTAKEKGRRLPPIAFWKNATRIMINPVKQLADSWIDETEPIMDAEGIIVFWNKATAINELEQLADSKNPDAGDETEPIMDTEELENSHAAKWNNVPEEEGLLLEPEAEILSEPLDQKASEDLQPNGYATVEEYPQEEIMSNVHKTPTEATDPSFNDAEISSGALEDQEHNSVESQNLDDDAADSNDFELPNMKALQKEMVPLESLSNENEIYSEVNHLAMEGQKAVKELPNKGWKPAKRVGQGIASGWNKVKVLLVKHPKKESMDNSLHQFTEQLSSLLWEANVSNRATHSG